MIVMDKQNTYASDFERFEREAGADVPSWVPPLRKAAFSRFAELGFPTRHHEEWRFTNVTPIAETPFALARHRQDRVTAGDLARVAFDLPSSPQLVFVNGRFAPEISALRPLPQGVLVGGLGEALRADPMTVEPHLARHAGFEHQPFVALNTAFLQDGAFVFVPKNTVVEEPIHLLFVSTAPGKAAVSHPRTLIVVGENSQATLIESYAGLEQDVYFTNAVTEIVAGENAVVDHYKLNRESRRAYHIAATQIHLARGSNFASQNITLGGALVRNDINALLGGEGGECTLNGLYLADGRRLVDNHTAIDHATPHCASHELYKGILDGRARGVFNGKIFVRQDAQKTDAKQTNQTLLLSDDAQINTKPQLEIYADDVRCTHGATIGQLSEEQIFYLRARGIGREDARNLLLYAFAGDIIGRIKVEPVRAQLDRALFAQLAKSQKGEEDEL